MNCSNIIWYIYGLYHTFQAVMCLSECNTVAICICLHMCLSLWRILCMPLHFLGACMSSCGCVFIHMCMCMCETSSMTFLLDLCSFGSTPNNAKKEGRATETMSQKGSPSLGEVRSKAWFGLDETSKHSSFATTILFSHHFNFKDLSGCINICFW